MSKSVATAAPRRVTLREHVVDVNVKYGGGYGDKGKWSLILAKRTGRHAAGNEVLECIDSHRFEGVATPAQYRRVKRWLLRHHLYDDDYEFVAVAIKQLNRGMKRAFARWKNE